MLIVNRSWPYTLLILILLTKNHVHCDGISVVCGCKEVWIAGIDSELPCPPESGNHEDR